MVGGVGFVRCKGGARRALNRCREELFGLGRREWRRVTRVPDCYRAVIAVNSRWE